MVDRIYTNFIQKDGKSQSIAANARVGSQIRNIDTQKLSEKKQLGIPPIKLKDFQIDSDRVDLAAAGVKDLNNFKGYHNQEENKNEEANRVTDPKTGAHFKFPDMCSRLINIMKNRLQERKVM